MFPVAVTKILASLTASSMVVTSYPEEMIELN